MNDLNKLIPTKPFLVCIDSDGCVFDTMELKHKECFVPATVLVWNLQGISKYVRETAEFVNLYSKTRGYNRFLALIRTFELLKTRQSVLERGIEIADLTPLINWAKETDNLSTKGLVDYINMQTNPNPIILQTLAWSKEVDENIKRMVKNVKPFPYVHKTLEKISKKADIVIVSSTPFDTIVREWEEQNMMQYLHGVAGQEQGTKEACIAQLSLKYNKQNIIMLGDSLNDRVAADLNDVFFYPIIPNNETNSWKDFYQKAFVPFIDKSYNNNLNPYYLQFQKELIDTPKWVLK
ncbi:HAD family hydrolase [Acholeplasma manati]|uniref:HAD family hydrolase n=1 Tax=Paracholeplasma manati TaxID=591373 RepID=A0ABT2Y477_9MOLU|nr:HAD family hydrolase [Paracholeplasma manati]MCV2231268.1 HAD family hydrolase [Paracholeplasma manati]